MFGFSPVTPIQKAAYLFLISMLPVVELRGGIPVGAYLELPWLETFLICVAGNMLPVPFIIIFIRRVFIFLKKFNRPGKWIRALEKRIMRRADVVIKYQLWGLLLFVAIPFPGTGAWTGAAIAVFLGIRLKSAVPTIFLGVLTAGVIMTLAAYGFVGFLSFLK